MPSSTRIGRECSDCSIGFSGCSGSQAIGFHISLPRTGLAYSRVSRFYQGPSFVRSKSPFTGLDSNIATS